MSYSKTAISTMFSSPAYLDRHRHTGYSVLGCLVGMKGAGLWPADVGALVSWADIWSVRCECEQHLKRVLNVARDRRCRSELNWRVSRE